MNFNNNPHIVFKKFQEVYRKDKFPEDKVETMKFNENLRAIYCDEELASFKQFLFKSADNQSNSANNDNLFNSNIIIDFAKFILLISFEAIIKYVNCSSEGYMVVYHSELRGFTDTYYPVLIKRQLNVSEKIIFNNKSLGPYVDSHFPNYDVLNNVIDLYHFLNKSSPSIIDLEESFKSHCSSLDSKRLFLQNHFNSSFHNNAININNYPTNNEILLSQKRKKSIIKILINEDELTEETRFQTKKIKLLGLTKARKEKKSDKNKKRKNKNSKKRTKKLVL